MPAPGSHIGEIKHLPSKMKLTGEGLKGNEPLDIEALFWGDNLRIVTAPHRWTGTAWERIE
jgi:hypothetical protein